MTPNDRDTGDSPDDRSLEELPLSLDVLLDTLASERRRALIAHLRDQPEAAGSFEEATKAVLTEIARKQGYQPNHDDVQSSLQHHHIPKLEDAGVIEYDSQTQTIRYHENERLETVLERVSEFEID